MKGEGTGRGLRPSYISISILTLKNRLRNRSECCFRACGCLFLRGFPNGEAGETDVFVSLLYYRWEKFAMRKDTKTLGEAWCVSSVNFRILNHEIEGEPDEKIHATQPAIFK